GETLLPDTAQMPVAETEVPVKASRERGGGDHLGVSAVVTRLALAGEVAVLVHRNRGEIVVDHHLPHVFRQVRIVDSNGGCPGAVVEHAAAVGGGAGVGAADHGLAENREVISELILGGEEAGLGFSAGTTDTTAEGVVGQHGIRATGSGLRAAGTA